MNRTIRTASRFPIWSSTFSHRWELGKLISNFREAVGRRSKLKPKRRQISILPVGDKITRIVSFKEMGISAYYFLFILASNVWKWLGPRNSNRDYLGCLFKHPIKQISLSHRQEWERQKMTKSNLARRRGKKAFGSLQTNLEQGKSGPFKTFQLRQSKHSFRTLDFFFVSTTTNEFSQASFLFSKTC